MLCYINDLFGRVLDNGKTVYCFKVSDLCKASGISRTYFYKLVNDECVPSLEVAYNICDYINYKLQEDYTWTVQDLWH